MSGRCSEAESLRRELAGVLERLAQCHTANEDYAGAIAHTRRWLELDPLHEPAQRMLMRLYAESGDRAAACTSTRNVCVCWR